MPLLLLCKYTNKQDVKKIKLLKRFLRKSEERLLPNPVKIKI